jgi:hypothetical protein
MLSWKQCHPKTVGLFSNIILINKRNIYNLNCRVSLKKNNLKDPSINSRQLYGASFSFIESHEKYRPTYFLKRKPLKNAVKI